MDGTGVRRDGRANKNPSLSWRWDLRGHGNELEVGSAGMAH